MKRAGPQLRWWLVLVAAVLLPVVASCRPIKAYERGKLVSASMQPSGDPLESSADDHVHTTREAGRGANGSKGATCGCN